MAVLVAALAAAGLVLFNHDERRSSAPLPTRVVADTRPLPTVPNTDPVSIPTPVVTVPSPPPGSQAVAPSPSPPPPPPITAPIAVEIPAIRVAAPIDPLGLDRNNALEVPTDFSRVGWYADGARPGADGVAVLEGHVDSRSGPGVFYSLKKLKPGDDVRIRRTDGSLVTFTVQRSASYKKTEFPTGEVYGSAGEPSLRLITCTGTFDASARSYENNLVVFATLKG